jgi:hypothetical protein
MSERTEERTRDREPSGDSTASDDTRGFDVGNLGQSTDEAAARESTANGEGGLGRFFSLRALVGSFVAVALGMGVGGVIPLIPFTGVLGIALGGFVYGLLSKRGRYIEIALAGGTVAGLAIGLQFLPRALVFEGFDGTRLFAIAAGIGLLLAVVGHYFGRDLRDGLTQDLS